MSHVDGDAKEMEEEVQALEQQERFQLLRTGQWTEPQTRIWNERRGVVDRAWDEALSVAQGSAAAQKKVAAGSRDGATSCHRDSGHR